MLRIRLTRTGKKKQPSYRIVVAEARMPRDGKFIEHIGYYNPLFDPPSLEVAEDKARLWLSRGAKPSATVERLLQVKGILEKAN
jgi:small subunit ribosomal protein S16